MNEVLGFRFQVSGFRFLAAVLGLLAFTGCTRTSQNAPTPQAPPTPLSSNTVLRVHWAGKNTLGVAASAYSIIRLWELPESKQLQGQFLFRLAGAMGGVSEAGDAATRSSTLATLFEDVVNQETFLEIRRTPNRTEDLVFAVRLDETKAIAWHQSLASALSTMRGVHPTLKARSWTLKDPHTQNMIELTRAGEWTVVGIAADKNMLLEETVARTRETGTPGGFQDPASWLEAEADGDWVRTKVLLSPAGTTPLPKLVLKVTGDGANVLTQARLDFATPLNLNLEPWRFPTGQRQNPVASFTGMRGLGAWVDGTKAWAELKLGAAPNQVFVWSDAAYPLQMHLAASTQTASPLPSEAASLAQRGNEWLEKNGLGRLEVLAEPEGVVWRGLPLLTPFLRTAADGWLTGGSLVDAKPGTNAPPGVYPRLTWEALVADINSRSNLVAYAWETTAARVESLYMASQVMRLARRHPQLAQDTPSQAWIQAIRPRLGNSITTVSLTGANQLTLERRASAGLTAAELQWLSDWLESPEFPRGLHSTRTRQMPASAFGARP